jgi:hypothetical protein
VIEMYAITSDPTPPLPDPSRLATVRAGALLGVWAPLDDDAAGAVTPHDLWRYESVVESLMADRDLLPMRFGTRLPDVATAAQILHERLDHFVAALDHVRGAIELGLRVVAAPDRHVDRADALEAVHAPLAATVRDSRIHSHAEHELLRAAYLVDRHAITDVTDRVTGLQRAEPDLRLLCTGPWPPYSFVA